MPLFFIAAILPLLSWPAGAFFEDDEVLKKYGVAGGYSVEFTRNGICIARRRIAVRELHGGLRSGGEFGFGIAEYGGLYVTLVSFLDPNWDYPPGQTARGTVDIDGLTVFSTFYVEERTVVSVTLPESMLRNVAFSRKMTFRTDRRAYAFRPTQASTALPLLMECVRGSLKAGDRPARLWGGVRPALP